MTQKQLCALVSKISESEIKTFTPESDKGRRSWKAMLKGWQLNTYYIFKKGNKEKTNDLKNSIESDFEDANVCFNLLDEDAEDNDFVDVV